jgi:hypothetical protein
VWFTEKDSGYVGTLIFPKECGAASATEYGVSPKNPYKITFAEKAFTVSDNAVRPAKQTKHKPTVWFNNYTTGFMGGSYSASGDTLYGLEPAAKKSTTGYLMAYPTSSQTMHAGTPQTVQWAPAVKIDRVAAPACLWFNGFYYPPGASYPSLKIYSLQPQAKGILPYEATLTEFSFPATVDLVMAMHVENGLVWFLHMDAQGSAMYLYMMPVTGGGGYRWALGSNSMMYGGVIEPMYRGGKPKPGVLPNQVWINLYTIVFVLSLNPTSAAVDTLCGYPMAANNYLMGLYSDNLQKANPAKYMNAASFAVNTQTMTATSNINFLRGAPSSTVSREAVAYSTATTKVSGIVRTVSSKVKALAPSCGTTVATSVTTSGCLATEWDASIGGSYLDLGGGSVPPSVNISGIADAKKFDLVSYQIGGNPIQGLSTTNEPAICRMWGKFSATANIAPSNEPDYSFADESEETEQATEFVLSDAYPNPFNPTTTIQFTLPVTTAVTLKVYNMLGEEVATLINGVVMNQGRQQVEFNASNLSSGVYFYRIQAGNYTAMKKVVLIK